MGALLEGGFGRSAAADGRALTGLYRYIHVSDDGRAPCVDDHILTLGTCKPVIRRCARIGDWVMGFYASPMPRGVLCWAGRIGGKIGHIDYERQFGGRADAAYRMDGDGRIVRVYPDYHAREEDMSRDLSGPVLMFDRDAIWYFGDSPVSLPPDLQHLAPRGEGHRVNGVLDGDAERLESWLRALLAPGFHGRPRHADEACGSCDAPARRSKGPC